MRTYQTMYQNEVRALEITINQQDGQEFTPSGAFVTITDAEDNIVLAEQTAQVEDNFVRTVIGTLVTQTIGEYKVLWKIVKEPYTYYHVTDLDVVEP